MVLLINFARWLERLWTFTTSDEPEWKQARKDCEVQYQQVMTPTHSEPALSKPFRWLLIFVVVAWILAAFYFSIQGGPHAY